MRLASFSTTLAIACMSLISLPVSAQQTQGTSDPLPGPPTITAPPPQAQSSQTVGVAPPVTSPSVPAANPEQTVPLAPVRAAPCSVFARETDGTTTCIGIPSHRRR
jgi:hypothetical protein